MHKKSNDYKQTNRAAVSALENSVFGPWRPKGLIATPGVLAYGPLGAGPKLCPLLGLLLGLAGALRAKLRLSLRTSFS